MCLIWSWNKVSVNWYYCVIVEAWQYWHLALPSFPANIQKIQFQPASRSNISLLQSFQIIQHNYLWSNETESTVGEQSLPRWAGPILSSIWKIFWWLDDYPPYCWLMLATKHVCLELCQFPFPNIYISPISLASHIISAGFLFLDFYNINLSLHINNFLKVLQNFSCQVLFSRFATSFTEIKDVYQVTKVSILMQT